MSNTTIPKSTFTFLKELKNNNDREWFAQHKPRYLDIKSQLEQFLYELTEQLNRHDTIGKKRLYRIYRDVRFRKDKTPYKTFMAMEMQRATAARRGGFFVKIAPNNSLAGGGFYSPDPKDLLRIRKEIAFNAQPLRNILNQPKFIQMFPEGMQGKQLKTAPKGFDKTHQDIDLLRYKQYFFSHAFTDKQVLAPNFIDQLVEVYTTLLPFYNYMTEVLTTNENGESIL